MKIIFSAGFALACAFSIHAQIFATLNRLPDGSSEIRIRNGGTASIAAFAASVSLSGGNLRLPGPSNDAAPLVFYYDPAIDERTEALIPNQERALPPIKLYCGGPGRSLTRPPFCQFERSVAAAGIYADGTTTGDAALLTKMLLRRSNMLLAVETSLETLTEAGRRNVPRDQLIEQFRKLADSSRRWYVPREQQIASGVYQSIVEKLVNLPVSEPGDPFPPTAFVAEEGAMLSRQRANLIESQPSLAEGAVFNR
jgi:hypothetical protein